MNTADRSIALLDAALRRRFAFIELMPDSTVLRGVGVGGLPLEPWLDALNTRIRQHAGRDARNLQIGHSYLMAQGKPLEDEDQFAEVLRYDIIPLLQEYCYDDFGALARILGSQLVDTKQQRIKIELLEESKRTQLFQALVGAFSEITATKEAGAVDATAEADELDDDSETETDSDEEGSPE